MLATLLHHLVTSRLAATTLPILLETIGEISVIRGSNASFRLRAISPNPGSKTRLREFERCAQLFELSVYVALRLWLVCLRSPATDACPMPTPASAHLKSGGRIPSDA